MTATLPATLAITEPGVYDLTDVAYHLDPVPGGSLSSSGARKLLPPSCPALFKYERDNPPTPSATFSFGHAAHQQVLGAGPELVVVDAADWRTKAAQATRDEAYEAGKVPLLPDAYAQVQAMAKVIREHPIAAALLRPDRGQPEQSLFWVDDETQVWRRSRLDWLPNSSAGRMIVPDYKSTVSAAPDHIQKAVHQYGYHCQAAWYVDAVKALGLADDAAFVLICQEKTAPYLVTVAEPAESALLIGRDLNRRALRLYRDCVTNDRWPGYSEDVELIALPAWAERLHDFESA